MKNLIAILALTLLASNGWAEFKIGEDGEVRFFPGEGSVVLLLNDSNSTKTVSMVIRKDDVTTGGYFTIGDDHDNLTTGIIWEWINEPDDINIVQETAPLHDYIVKGLVNLKQSREALRAIVENPLNKTTDPWTVWTDAETLLHIKRLRWLTSKIEAHEAILKQLTSEPAATLTKDAFLYLPWNEHPLSEPGEGSWYH